MHNKICSTPGLFEALAVKTVSGHEAIFVSFQDGKTLRVPGSEKLQRLFKKEPGSYCLVASIHS